MLAILISQIMHGIGAVDIKFVTVGVANIARRQYIINTSLPGLVGNMARHCTRVQHFPSPMARENTCTHSCNISPYCPVIVLDIWLCGNTEWTVHFLNVPFHMDNRFPGS